MLFGTYQRIYDPGKEKPKNLITSKRTFNKSLGFAPLWAFPIDDLRGMIAHSICAAPNFADIFYVIETDDFLRVDKIKHEQKIRNNAYHGGPENWDFADVIDDGIDNDYSEIIIDQEKIKFENIRCFAPVANAKNNAMEQIRYIGPKPLNNSEEMNWLAETIRLWADRIPDINVFDIERFLIQAGFSEEYAEVEGRQRANKFVFEMSMFPFLYRSYISRDEINGYYLGALCCNARQFFMADREFCRWAKDDCSVEGYDAVFNKIRNLVVEDEEMLKMAADQKKIYPNEPCPCGSGKKYKRCHGRFC